ncbi:hypothetical protein EPO15_17355 [bacterium]|nr:MAG: hypothetical protein EPO15_17355 [bacterium]
MRLYLDGRLATGEAGDVEARAALAQVRRGEAAELRLRDGKRTLTLAREEGPLWFLEVEDPTPMFYGMMLLDFQASGALTTFLKGGLPLPGGFPPLPEGGDGFEHVVVGEATHPDCPLCRMMGLGG